MLALVVNVSERELSEDVSPSFTSAAVIVMDGVPGMVVVVVVVVVVERDWDQAYDVLVNGAKKSILKFISNLPEEWKNEIY